MEQNNNLPIIDNFIDSKTCIVAGSTWAEDEALLTPYINSTTSDLKFIIAPHNIDKQRVQKLLKKLGKKACLHSDHDIDTLGEKQVLIIDSIGLLSKVYSYANIAYVGGAMGNTGLHNILEPAVFGIPIIIGKNYNKFPEAIEMLKIGGVYSVKNLSDLKKIFEYIMKDNKWETLGKINKEYIEKNKGATMTITEKIRDITLA